MGSRPLHSQPQAAEQLNHWELAEDIANARSTRAGRLGPGRELLDARAQDWSPSGTGPITTTAPALRDPCPSCL